MSGRVATSMNLSIHVDISQIKEIRPDISAEQASELLKIMESSLPVVIETEIAAYIHFLVDEVYGEKEPGDTPG